MDPDIVEISPSMFTSRSSSRKPRKGVPEVIDVEKYECSKNNNNNNNNNNNKGKGIEYGPTGTYDNNPFSQYNNTNGVVMMDVDDLSMYQNGFGSYAQQAVNPWGVNLNGFAQPWDLYAGSAFHQNHAMYSAALVQQQQQQVPDVWTMPSPNTSAASSSRFVSQSVAAEVVVPDVRKTKEEFLKNFKRFDTVEDYRDHHYATKGTTSKQHSKSWAKRIQNDWKILENDLPETIFVRAYESRMDLMRAVIIGPEGTPYHDGLFFFDIQFPDTYPSVPPKVYYHSGGLRINPNLYNCGKVCLSLLGTWQGNSRENWLPKESTMLQLLVSIQALILNQKPYFNEPGYASSQGKPSAEAASKIYSENVFILSLKTMVYSMKRPPTHFEEFVRSHYYVRALDIVKACDAYRDGAPVASMVKGGVQDLEESSQSGSKKFRTDVVSFKPTVVAEFVKLGVNELEEINNINIEITNTATRKRNRTTRLLCIIVCVIILFFAFWTW